MMPLPLLIKVGMRSNSKEAGILFPASLLFSGMVCSLFTFHFSLYSTLLPLLRTEPLADAESAGASASLRVAGA